MNENTELKNFLKMLGNSSIGHGYREDHNPEATAVQVEHDDEDDDSVFWVTEWMFDAAGKLSGVKHSRGEVG